MTQSWSPLPWRQFEKRHEIFDARGQFVARAKEQEGSIDAAFIVKAVNCHEELLAACRTAENAFTRQVNAPLGTRLAQRKTALSALRSAIAKAEGGQ